MNQAVGMNHLHGGAKGQRLLRLPAAHPAEFQRQNGPQTLASGKQAVVGRLKNGLLRLAFKGCVDGGEIFFNHFPVDPGLLFKFHHRRPPPEGFRRALP